MCQNYENWLAVDKVIAKIIRLTFFWPTLYRPNISLWADNATEFILGMTHVHFSGSLYMF